MTATAIAIQEDTRRQLRERLRVMPVEGDLRQRIRRLRSMLEEMGVQCDDTAELQDCDGVLLVSQHGAEAVVAARLTDEQRLEVYARVVARLLVTELHDPIDARVEYRSDHDHPSSRERQEREEDAVVGRLARAVVDGRLDAAPRPLYDDVPRLTFAFTPRTAARSTLGGFHLWSGFWYRRSNLYRRWRSRRDVSEAIHRISIVLDPAAPVLSAS